jgi:uncharacterized protein involved in exopolysaccharide biosynthesis
MQEREVNILKLWESIWSNRKFIIIFCLIIAVFAAGISLILPKWYKASASILPPSSGSGAFGAITSSLSSMGFGGLLDGSGDSTTRLLAIAKSRKIRQMINDKYDFTTRYKSKFNDDALKQLAKKTVISTGREDELTITFYDKDQEVVAEVVQFIIDKLDNLEIQFSQNQALENRDFISGRVNEITDSLYILQNELRVFMEDHDIISIPDQVAAEIGQAAQMKAEIAAMEIELKTSRNMYNSDNLIITQLEEKLALTRETYQEFFYSPQSKLFLDLQSIPQYQLTYITLERKMEYLVTLLQFLGPQYENAKIEAANNVSRIQVLDEPKRPDRRHRPRRGFLVVLATFFAFCLSLFIIYLKAAVLEAKLEEHNQI